MIRCLELGCSPSGPSRQIELIADRISFDPGARSVSFNLNTDAKEISVEGIELPVPIAEPRTQEGLSTVQSL